MSRLPVEEVTVFHAGTAPADSGPGLDTAGGRVLGVTAAGRLIAAARDRAYAGWRRPPWPGVLQADTPRHRPRRHRPPRGGSARRSGP